MRSRHFILFIWIRMLLILITMTGLSYLLTHTSDADWYATILILFAILALQIWELIRKLSHTNRSVARFFDAVRHADFNIQFASGENPKEIRDLDIALNKTIESFHKIKQEQAGQLQFYQYLTEKIQTGIICWDDKKRIHLQNPAARDMLSLQDPLNFNDLIDKIPQMKRPGDSLPSSFVLEARKKNQIRSILVKARNFTLYKQAFYLLTLEDVTEELHKSENEAWQKLLRILAHEMRNSITPVTSIAETLDYIWRGENGGHKTHGQFTEKNIQDSWVGIQALKDRGKKLHQFVEDALRLSVIPLPAPVMINVAELFNRIILFMKHDKSAEGVSFEIFCQDDALAFFTDPTIMEQILINLVSNAAYAMNSDKPGLIRLSASIVDDNVILEVFDNGKGIPEALMQEIFVPFFTTRKNGVGLGLPITRQLVDLLKGTISVESESGLWTRFTLTFQVSGF